MKQAIIQKSEQLWCQKQSHVPCLIIQETSKDDDLKRIVFLSFFRYLGFENRMATF